jgi:hypothetical protein
MGGQRDQVLLLDRSEESVRVLTTPTARAATATSSRPSGTNPVIFIRSCCQRVRKTSFEPAGPVCVAARAPQTQSLPVRFGHLLERLAHELAQLR